MSLGGPGQITLDPAVWNVMFGHHDIQPRKDVFSRVRQQLPDLQKHHTPQKEDVKTVVEDERRRKQWEMDMYFFGGACSGFLIFGCVFCDCLLGKWLRKKMVLCPSLNSCLIFLLGHGFKRVQTGSAQSSASLARHDMQFFAYMYHLKLCKV